MAKELEALGKPILELTGFWNLVKQYFPDVFLPRTCRLGKCGICTTFVQERLKAVSKKDVDYYRNLRVKHLEQVRQERLSYYTRRA